MTLKERYEGVIDYFKTNVPIAETELNYNNPFELIVAVILSAQCTDVRINKVTPKLFNAFPDAETMAASNPDVIFNYIRSVSYPNNKAKHLVGMTQMLLNDFNGIVPSEIDQLIKLPGVGRKTANVVASVVYNKPAMAVDTHVFRVSNRLGLTKATNPLQSETQLMKHIPLEYVATAHHWLILHGRYTCLARTPQCEKCPLTEWCNYFKKSHNMKTTAIKKTDSAKKVASSVSATAKKVTSRASVSAKKQDSSASASAKKQDSSASATTKKVASRASVSAKKQDSSASATVKKEAKFKAHETALVIGKKAPAFKGKDQHGNTIALTDLKGKKVILYFYPKDNTPGCTNEACSLRDEHTYFTKENYVVLGVSADDEKMHQKFATKYSLPFSLLADTDMKIIKAYDVWGTKQFMGKIYDGIIRTTFIINEKGTISEIIKEVNTKDHATQIKGTSH